DWQIELALLLKAVATTPASLVPAVGHVDSAYLTLRTTNRCVEVVAELGQKTSIRAEEQPPADALLFTVTVTAAVEKPLGHFLRGCHDDRKDERLRLTPAATFPNRKP